ncbi:MAG: CPBP family intramembrane metalloprotease [Chloroflexi bacterium]|nr:CPBP family intramembrane metalloprotease [Chloroflexota bacterium]
MEDSLSKAKEHLERANAYKVNNEIEKALYEVECANRWAPNWADPHYLRGLLLESLGRSQEAQAAFHKAELLDLSFRKTNSVFDGNKEEAATTVPWTARDVWLGFALFIGIVIAFIGVSVALWLLSIEIKLELLIVINEALFLVPVWWFAWRRYGSDWKTLGFRGFDWNIVWIGFGLLFASYIFTIIYGLIVTQIFDSEMQPDLGPVADEMSFPWLLIITAVVIAPVVEEIFFRGFIFAGFRQRYGWQKAALISSALFALVHMQPLAFIPLFILGYIFAFLYHRSNSILPGILMHFIVNLWGVFVEFVILSD